MLIRGVQGRCSDCYYFGLEQLIDLRNDRGVRLADDTLYSRLLFSRACKQSIELISQCCRYANCWRIWLIRWHCLCFFFLILCVRVRDAFFFFILIILSSFLLWRIWVRYRSACLRFFLCAPIVDYRKIRSKFCGNCFFCPTWEIVHYCPNFASAIITLCIAKLFA